MHRGSFLPFSADGKDRPAGSTLELSELLTRAKSAIDQAREQIQKTQSLITEFTENRRFESAPGVAFVRRSTFTQRADLPR